MESPVAFAISDIRKLAKASGVLDKNSDHQLAIACEASKAMLKARAKLLVEAAGRGAVLTSKSCDGTPLVATVHYKAKLSSGESVAGHGRAGHEFLVSNQFFRSRRADGSWNTSVTLSEPVVLSHGKSVNAILEASRAGWKTLRQMGHLGPAVEHYCWDRAGISALERLTRQWHLDLPLPTLPSDMSAKTCRLLEFVLVTPCALHDCQNGFRWGMLEQCSDRDLLRDVYVGIESLRNSAGLINSQMSLWVSSRLSPKADRSDEWKARQNTLWETLDVPFDVAHLLSHQLQLCFVDGRLQYFEDAEHGLEQDVVSEICAVLLSMWRFQKFTESRWLTVGASARRMLAAWLTGLPDFVMMIRQDESLSHFYINGFSRLTQDRLAFLVVAGMSSRVAEGVQGELMKDNRVAIRYAELWSTASAELRWLIDLEHVWDVFSPFCGIRPDMLRHECICAGHRCYHFIWRRVLFPASQHPWSLCRGNLLNNLEELECEEDKPVEPVAGQLWELMVEKDWPKAQLVEVLQLIGQCGWTSLVAEQQHASLAQLKKWHPDYGSTMLVSRALMLQVSRLLPSESDVQKQIRKVVKQMDKLDASNPNKVHGRQIFLKTYLKILHKRTMDMDEGGQDVRRVWDLRFKSFWSRHGQLFAQQSLYAQEECSRRAKHYQEQRHQEIRDDLASLNAQLQVLTLREGEEAMEDLPMMMSQAGLTDEDLQRYTTLATDRAFTNRSRLNPLRAAAVECPPPLGQHVIERLSQHDVWCYRDPKQPEWANLIIRDREGFVDSVLMVDDPDEGDPVYYKIVYAVKSPNTYLALCRCEWTDEPGEWHCEGDDMWAVAEWSRHCVLKCNFAQMRTAADIGDKPIVMLSVMVVTKHEGGTMLTCCSEPTRLDRITDRDSGLRVDIESDDDELKPKAKKSKSDKSYDSLLKDLPWLIYLDKTRGFESREEEGDTDAGASTSRLRAAVMEADAEPIPEDIIISTMAEMERARGALAEELADAPGADFVIALRGGSRAKQASGKAPDAVQAKACTDKAEDFCARRKLQKTFKGTFSEHDGQDNCLILCRSWAHRMQFFLDLENSSEAGPSHEFSLTDISSYIEPAELARLVARTTKASTLNRAAFVRGIPHANKR